MRCRDRMDERALALRERGLQFIDRDDRVREAHAIARRSAQAPDPSRQPLQVADALELVGAASAEIALEKLLDRIVAIANHLEAEQRIDDPVA